MDPNQYQNDRDEHRFHTACGLQLLGQLGLQPISFHVETYSRRQFVSSAKQFLPPRIFLQRRRRGIFVENAPREIPSSGRSDIFRYAAPDGALNFYFFWF